MSRHRQLVAIMFTDIQGYTALMQEDEKKAISIRERHREVFNRLTKKHEGKILQYYGDGTLSIFDSAIEAVTCGIELQLAYLKDPTIPVRIGIHTGDIIVSDEEVIGDGVNVASRIESLAVPGSVLVSEKVFDEIKNQTSIPTRFLKTFEFKNVSKPMEVYSVSSKGLIVPEIEDIRGKTKDALPNEIIDVQNQSKKNKLGRVWYPLTIIVLISSYFIYQNVFRSVPNIKDLDKSIAVLAFSNISNDPDQEYFSDGISEEILNSLTKVEGLKVAGRTSSFSFKGKNADIRTIGKELGVSLVLEGSVRRYEDQVRITAQLIKASDGFHVWSEQYDRELKDVFSIQEEIATKIVNTLRLTVLNPDGTKQPTNNLQAYDFYLKGIYAVSLDIDGVADALDHFQKAIELDPEFALAYAGKGDAYLNASAYGIMPVDKALMEARRAANKSILLDGKQAYGHKVLAFVHLFYDWDWDAAKSEYEKAVALGLTDPDYFTIWYEAVLNENYDIAIQNAKIIVRRDALSVEAHWYLGLSYYLGRRYNDAIGSFQAALELNPNYSEAHRGMGICYRQMKMYDESLTALGKALELTQGHGPAVMDLLAVLGASGQREALKARLDNLHEIALTQPMPPIVFAIGYAHLGEMDEAFKWLEATYNERFLWLLSIKAAPDWDIFRNDPRYEELIKKMNFPE